MALAGHPPHRTGRAELPHPALVLGKNVQQRFRTKMVSLSPTFRSCSSATSYPGLWLCVQQGAHSRTFPLTGGFPSISSNPFELFGNFVGTTPPSDCLSAFIFDLRPQTSRSEPSSPSLSAWSQTGSPDSRSECFQACSGSPTAQSLLPTRLLARCSFAFRIIRKRRRSEVDSPFAAQYLTCLFSCQRFA